MEKVSNCMNFVSRRMLKSLQYKSIRNFVVSNLPNCQKAFVQRATTAAVVFDTTFPLPSSLIKLSGTVKEDKGL